MAAKRPLLYLVDGSNALHRAFHAIRSLNNSKGFPTNAVYGFAAILRKLVREHKPTHVGIAFDISESTARKEAYADYKAQRKPMADDLAVQIPYIRRLCEAFRMPILELHGFEADDVIATLATKAAAQGIDVVLFTTDKDFLQLVGPRIRMYQAMREKMLDAAGVEEFFGVPPERVGDVLAIMGDASDNVPGVPGIGEVGARKLVQQYGSLEEVLAHAPEVTARKAREALLSGAESARLSRRLVELERTLPVELDMEALKLDPADPEKLKALYSELEFHSLVEELEAAAPGSVEEVSFRKLSEDERFAPAAGCEALGVSIVPLGVPGNGSPAPSPAPEGESGNLPLGRPADAPGVPRFLFAISDGAATAVGEETGEELARRLAGMRGVSWVSPDAKGVDAFLLRHGVEDLPTIFDPCVARYVLASGTSNPEFEAIALDLFRRKAATAREAGIPPGSLATAARYAAERARWALEMREKLGAELDAKPNLRRVFDRIESPLTPVLARMEAAGVLVDVPYLKALSERMAADLARLESEIFSEAGEAFNVASPPQLSRILFEKLNLPAGKRTAKTKTYSTGVETLQGLASQGYRIASLLMEHREISKLKGTYADALPLLVDAGDRIHAKFNQTVAATGRLSSSDPNLQNIPIRTEAGREIRRGFIAPEGHRLLAADYSQIELRILAHVSGDASMIQAFAEGQDVHRATAAKVFNVSPDLVTLEMRIAAKRINFGLLYGMGAFSLAKDLGVPTGEAKLFIEAYFAQFPGVRATLESVVEGARREGLVTTIFGRERPIPEIRSSNGMVRANAERMAQNAPFQGSAADIVKLAMIAVDRTLREAKMRTRMLLQVHDELLFEVPDDELDDARARIVAGMESAATLAVPLKVDVGVGRNWLEAK
ncbi:MAG TPA: DNA polymerase I [Thermoanaerobaculia bacterium]|nr:DNA polymerase I [Thermoanaerobaculia bacterium]